MSDECPECPTCGSKVPVVENSDVVQIVITGPKRHRQKIVDKVHALLAEDDLLPNFSGQDVVMNIYSTLEPSEEMWG